jgi:hypothetical protein
MSLAAIDSLTWWLLLLYSAAALSMLALTTIYSSRLHCSISLAIAAISNLSKESSHLILATPAFDASVAIDSLPWWRTISLYYSIAVPLPSTIYWNRLSLVDLFDRSSQTDPSFV